MRSINNDEICEIQHDLFLNNLKPHTNIDLKLATLIHLKNNLYNLSVERGFSVSEPENIKRIYYYLNNKSELN